MNASGERAQGQENKKKEGAILGKGSLRTTQLNDDMDVRGDRV